MSIRSRSERLSDDGTRTFSALWEVANGVIMSCEEINCLFNYYFINLFSFFRFYFFLLINKT